MKTILITGSSSGIGKETAKYFAAKGWNVVATMRSPEKESELTQLPNVLVTKLDVEDLYTIKESIAKGMERFGKIDVLMNNAGVAAMGVFEGLTDEQIRRVFDINVFGVMNTTNTILPHFRENKAGMIINISSMGGKIAMPIMSLYHATKFAVEGFSESLSFELASQNIKVKLVEPGAVETNFGRRETDFYFDESLKDYKEYNNLVRSALGKMGGNTLMAPPEAVAEAIYQITLEDSPQLRYLVGEDAKTMIGMRENYGDEAFIQSIRTRFS